MRTLTLLLLGLAIALTAGACNFFAPPSDIQTENLQADNARTEIAAIRTTATVEAERLLITAEYAAESITNADLQSTRIVSTLIALGTPFVEVPLVAGAAVAAAPTTIPAAVDPLAAASPAPAGAGGIPTSTVPAIANPLITPGLGGAAGGVTLPAVQPTAIAAQPTAGAAIAESSAPNLTEVTVSTTVGADDCALNPTTTFSAGVVELYAVATARNIQPGQTLSSRWTRDGVEAAFYEWTPDFAIDGACIWFNVPGAEVDLGAGAWTVQMAIDGVPIGSPLAFTIA